MTIDKAILVLVLMILGHLLADYLLQGWLAQAKAKSYWKNAFDKNKKDYIAALIGHSTMWGIITFIPIIYFSWNELGWLWLILPANIFIHCLIDNLKTNRNTINLIQDQLLHITQVNVTWILWIVFTTLE